MSAIGLRREKNLLGRLGRSGHLRFLSGGSNKGQLFAPPEDNTVGNLRMYPPTFSESSAHEASE